MALMIFEVLEKFTKAKNRNEKIAVLRQNNSLALRDVLQGSLDPRIEWLLPKGEVPYTPCDGHNSPTTLLRKHRDFLYCVKGGKGDNIPAAKRESIFLGIVESVHPKDAELVCRMINKKPLVKGLTLKIAQEAFPGLL
jgi:hypothetical protein